VKATLGILVLIFLVYTITPAVSIPTVPEEAGVFMVASSGGGFGCTGANVGVEGDTVIALTATHCWNARNDLIAVDPITAEVYGPLGFIKTDSDVTWVSYPRPATPVYIYPISPRCPERGEEIWSLGLGRWYSSWPMIVLYNYGRYIGSPVAKGREVLTTTPASRGMSGGPVFVAGRVFGIITSGYRIDEMVSSTWSGVTLLPNLTACG